MYGKFKFSEKLNIEDYFLDELQQLVLPADPLLDPRNRLVEAPKDDRFHMAQGIQKFIDNVLEVKFARKVERYNLIATAIFRFHPCPYYEPFSYAPNVLPYSGRV